MNDLAHKTTPRKRENTCILEEEKEKNREQSQNIYFVWIMYLYN